MNEFCAVDRYVQSFSERSDGSNMVSMVVRDDYSVNMPEVESHFDEIAFNGTCRNARIDKNAVMPGAEIVAIAATAGGETSENQFSHVLCCTNKDVQSGSICKGGGFALCCAWPLRVTAENIKGGGKKRKQ